MVTLLSMNVGELIKSALNKKSLSQSELADRVNMTPAQISRIISGERGTSIENLISIADALTINRDLILRAAAGLSTEKKKDEWIEEMNYKISLIPPSARKMAEKLLETFIDETRDKKK